uniref:Uncharacterized protein n=1 Tax=Acrobeloides nanus TaxID=290746 RepID=A0A914EFL1_9BILA
MFRTKLSKMFIEALISYAICWDPNPQGEYLVGYIFGGSCDPEGIEMSNKLYKFRIDVEGNLNFEELILESDENCKPTPRCGSSMIMDNEGKLYVIGGADDKCYLIDIWVIDMSQNRLKWKTIEIDAFDIKTQEFVKIHTLSDGEHGYPHSRQFHSSVTNENDVYLIGGWSSKKPNSNDTVAYADVWKLSPLMSGNEIYYKWTKTSTNLKMSLFFHTSAITSEGCVYTFGGCIDNKSLYPSNKIQRFWINTPTLKQISMFKTLANNPKVVEEFKKREIERVRNKKQKDIFYQDKMENVTVSMQEVKLENFETDDKNAEDNKLGSKQNDHFLNIRELRQSLPMRLIRLLNVMDN